MQLNKMWTALLGLAVMALFLGAPTAQSDEIFVQIDGIDGGSAKRMDLKGAIDVSAWQWSVSQPTATSLITSDRYSPGRAQVNAIMFQHQIDYATPKLYEAVFTGKSFASARVLVFRNITDRAPFIILTMRDVLVSEIGSSASENAQPMESFSMVFRKVELEYFMTDARTGEMRPTAPVKWDIEANTKY